MRVRVRVKIMGRLFFPKDLILSCWDFVLASSELTLEAAALAPAAIGRINVSCAGLTWTYTFFLLFLGLLHGFQTFLSFLQGCLRRCLASL